MVHLDRRADRDLFPARLLRHRSVPAGAADSCAGHRAGRQAAVRPRRHPRRPDSLAIGGRHAARLHLGPRRLPGARLDGRLAAPRTDGLAGTGRAGPARQGLRGARWPGAGGAARSAQARIPRQWRRCGAGAASVGAPGRGDPPHRPLLRPAVLGRACAAHQPRTLRDEGKHSAERRKAQTDDAVLLLDRLGRRHRTPRP